jgi:dTMP kinase
VIARHVTIEGIEGAGKTHLSRLMAERLGDRCALLGEITDQQDSSLTGNVITALSRTRDLWLRTGHPVTETLALLALKTAAHEHAARADTGSTRMFLEDRGIDSVAVYQALILAGPGAPDDRLHALMDQVYGTARRWLPLPGLTLLITDDPDACMTRLKQRTGQQVTAADRALVTRAARLYEWQAACDPGRFRIISRNGRTADETAADLIAVCTAGITWKEELAGA